ncbi:MAG: hypothetical protein K2Y08_00695 [Alphaproteobacteria bacterium]|nr:hypothetical protein [Alphaproteobacteria bacterium]
MTPEELATRHPQLYHVTEPGAWKDIKQNGLLSTTRLLDLFEIDKEKRTIIETQRRSSSMVIEHSRYGRAIINDNLPLNEKSLAKCLDHGLTPADWLRILNSRVFFWASQDGLDRLLGARLNRNRVREVLVIDTLSLAKAYTDQMELCPINSGATIRKAARRGLNTFSPLGQYSFNEWSRLRGQRDHIREVTVRDAVPDIANYILDVLSVG